MLDLTKDRPAPGSLSPAALAFVGDGVFELLVRERLCAAGSMPARKLHALAVKKVRASAQARAYPALEAALTTAEADILRRGRNLSSARVPRSCEPEEYRKATAVEALFGYLYLSGDVDRINELFDVIDKQ